MKVIQKINFRVGADTVLREVIKQDNDYFKNLLKELEMETTLTAYYETRKHARIKYSKPFIQEFVQKVKSREEIDDTLMDNMCCQIVYRYTTNRLVEQTIKMLEQADVLQVIESIYNNLTENKLGEDNSVNVF